MKKLIRKQIALTEAMLMEKKPLLKRLGDWTLNHFFKTFIILLIINIVLFMSGSTIPILVTLVAFLLLTLYVIIFLVKRIHTNVTKLLHHELEFNQILTVYVTSVAFVVLLFSMLYWGVMISGSGYLKYGSCIDNVQVTRDSLLKDPLLVSNFLHYPYFSAITFFSVGFGDICPMGASKSVAMLNALIGNAFTVLILAIAITNYSTNKTNDDEIKDNKKKEELKNIENKK